MSNLPKYEEIVDLPPKYDRLEKTSNKYHFILTLIFISMFVGIITVIFVCITAPKFKYIYPSNITNI
jgi:hypothetical protein